MRILFFSHYTELYGANRSLLNLLEGLQKIAPNVEPIVFCPHEGALTQQLEILHIPYHVFPFHYSVHIANSFSWVKSIVRQFKNLINFQQLLQLVRSLNPDIIYTNSSVLHIGAYVAYRLNLPHVWHIREFGLKDYQMKFDFGRKNFEKWLNRSSVLIAISKAIKNEVLYNVQAPIHVIYNGILFSKEISSMNLEKKEKPVIFCVTGALRKEKGQHIAIEAFASAHKAMPQSTLWLIGDGDPLYKAELHKLVDRYQLNNQVVFHGYVKQALPLLKQAHVGLMCSLNEGMGRVTAEYMACGLPVIGYNGGATPELIDHTIDGFLFENTAELSHYMIQLSDTSLQKQMGARAIQKAQDQFNIEKYASNIYQVLCDINTVKPSI